MEVSGSTTPHFWAEMTGSPRFLENPNACMPCSLTPAGPKCDAVLHQGNAFRQLDSVGSRD